MAQIRMRDAGGTLRTITQIRMRDAGNVLRTITQVRMRDAGGTLRTVWSAMTVALSAVFDWGYDTGLGAGPQLVGSAGVTVTPTGGTAPYTYNWYYVTGYVGMVPTTPNAATTQFHATILGVRDTAFACDVTDANGIVKTTGLVSVELEYEP